MPRISWPRTIPYFLIHILAFGVVFFPVTRACLWVFLGTYLLKTFGVSAGYHRYFSHRSFKASRGVQFILAILGATALQNGPLWWAAHHRVHHRYSDQPGDPHSPMLGGFLWAQVFWIFAYRTVKEKEVRDFTIYPELVWLNRYNQIPAVILGWVIYLNFGWAPFFWSVLSTVACWHTSSAVNSVGHRYGTQNHAVVDQSRNNWMLAILTLGEGWHNNHHSSMNSARHGTEWWQIDVTYYLLRFLSVIGVVGELK